MMKKLMKKIAVALTVATMALTATGAIASANERMYVANDIGVNVRKAASADSERLGGLYQGDELNVISVKNGWAEFCYNGGTAYAVADCLSTEKPVIVPTYTGNTDEYGFKSDVNVAEKGSYTVSVKPGTYLTLRNDRTSDMSAEIGQLHTGDKVNVIEGAGKFWLVDAPSVGRVGYVNSNYLV